MGRRVDHETKQQIERAARGLFLAKGFRAASYAEIAEAIGRQKSYVQRHFPKKEIFVEHFFQDLLDETDQFLAARGYDPDAHAENLYRIGVIQYSFLFHSPELRRFTREILASREWTESLIQKDMQWAAEYLSGMGLKDPAQSAALVMGGVYEVLYQHLTAGTEPDPYELQATAMHLYGDLLGAAPEPSFSQDLLPLSMRDSAVEYLQKVLFDKN